MRKDLRESGIDIIGDVPWGTHFCQFYQTKEDLADILVPYFKAGLENNEFCLWITSYPLEVEDAKEAMRRAVSNLDFYLDKGQIKIIPYTHWYLKEGIFDSERVLNDWVEKLNQALATGYDGVRLTRNYFWLGEKNWNDFVNLEERLDSIIGSYEIMALCTYSLDRCNAIEIIDIVANHRFSLIKREGIWEKIESPKRKEVEEKAIQATQDAEAKLKETYNHLEELVKERTMQLEQAYRRLKESEHDLAEVQKIAHKRLKESEQDLAEAQKMAHIGSWKWDILTGELHWSDEVYRIFGLNPQEFGATYDAFFNYIHPDDRDYMDNAVKTALNGKPYAVDYRIILANGSERIVHAQGEVIFNDENVPIRMKGTVQDITERKMAEEVIRLSNIYNRSLIEASLDPLVTIGPDGKITDVNNSTETITGHSRDELIGTDFSDYFTDPDKAKEGYQRVFQEGLVRDYPLEILHKDGRIIPVLYNASIYKNEAGEVIGVFAAARDITKLKKAEEKIQTLANAVESSDDAIITKSLDCIITSWNKGAEKVYGYSAEEVLGKAISILEPDNLEGETEQLIEQIKQGKRIRHYETLRLRKDGTIINVSVTLSPVFDSSGELVAISTIARDITERKKAEEAIRLSNIYNRSLIEASLDPLVTIGPDGKITDVNGATEQVTGRYRNELIGTDFSDYFTEPEKARKGYQHVFTLGEVRDYPLEIQRKDGHITPVLYNASIYKDELVRSLVFLLQRVILLSVKRQKKLSDYQIFIIGALLKPAWIL